MISTTFLAHINLNDSVRVKLSPYGRDLVRQFCGVCKVDAGGYSEMPLHEFVRAIGPHIPDGMGWMGLPESPLESLEILYVGAPRISIDAGVGGKLAGQVDEARIFTATVDASQAAVIQDFEARVSENDALINEEIEAWVNDNAHR